MLSTPSSTPVRPSVVLAMANSTSSTHPSQAHSRPCNGQLWGAGHRVSQAGEAAGGAGRLPRQYGWRAGLQAAHGLVIGEHILDGASREQHGIDDVDDCAGKGAVGAPLK